MAHFGIRAGTVLQISVGGTALTARVRYVLFRGRLPLDPDAAGKDESEYERVRDLDIFESSRGAIVIRRRLREKGKAPVVEWRVCRDQAEAAGKLDPADPLDVEALRECQWFGLVGQEV